MKRFIVLFSVLALTGFGAYRLLPWRKYTDAPLPYRFFSPSVKAGQRYPLVLFLHGAGERGSDNTRQMSNGAWAFASDSALARRPAFVLVPQCPVGSKWSEVVWSAPAHTLSTQMTGPLASVVHLVDSLLRVLPIDPKRVYVTGLSMGGFGTWELIERFPERFAAAVPVCGGADTTQAARAAGVPVWAFHGADDRVVIPERSRAMVRSLRRAGGQPRYTEYPGVGHAAWVPAYADTAMLGWLFAQRRP